MVTAALMSAAGTWLARRYALLQRLLDEPGSRRSHVEATPRGGGLGPVLAIAIVFAGLAMTPGMTRTGLVGALGGLIAVAGIGWWDDHRPLPAWIRLVVHVGAGIGLAAGFGLWTRDPPLAASIAVMAVVLTNVWNFMDGINGIASTQAALVAATASLMLTGAWSTAALTVAVASLAFLPFNFPRARVFLGDVGSGGLGFALAALGGAVAVRSLHDVALLALPASPFLIDAGLSLMRRVWRGERWWAPHTQHLYQVWARRTGHTAVALAYAAVTLCGAVLVMAARGAPPAFMMSLGLVWYMAGALLWWILQHVAAHGPGDTTERDR